MSLLREIQNDAINSSVDLSTILRKCKVLAARLGNSEFMAWVEHELNGYSSNSDLPAYRIIPNLQSWGTFVGFAYMCKRLPIPPSTIPEKYRDMVAKIYLNEPISHYSDAAAGSHKGQGQIISEWPADLIALVGSNIYRDMNCISAWIEIPSGVIISLVETVRNRILSFALQIEEEAPEAGEAPIKTTPVPHERVQQIFQTVIFGNVQNVAVGSNHFSQMAEAIIPAGDISSLKEYLASIGVAKVDLRRLEKAIDQDGKIDGGKEMGAKVAKWMGEMVRKAGSEAWSITKSVAGAVLAKALANYYGLE